MAQNYSKMYNSPIIQYTKKVSNIKHIINIDVYICYNPIKRKHGDTGLVLRKLRKFLKFHEIRKKHLIAISIYKKYIMHLSLLQRDHICSDFPASRRDIIETVTRDLEPDNVIQVVPSESALDITCIPRHKLDPSYLMDFKQVKDYFPDRVLVSLKKHIL